MEVKDLTTGDVDPQVNSEIQDDQNSSDVMVDETQDTSASVDGSISNEQAQEEAYAEAWDKVDLDDESIFDRASAPTNDAPVAPVDTPAVDPLSTTQDTNNNIGAFMVDKPTLKFKGKEIPIDSQEELISLAQKGMQMETAAAEIKPKRKVLKIVEGIPLEVLQAVADIHSGNTGAISFLKKQYGIEDTRSTVPQKEAGSIWDEGGEVDPVPAVETPSETESAYAPQIAEEDPVGEYWNEFAQSNPTGAAKVNETYSGLDDSFKTEIYTPEAFPYFVASVNSGEFDNAYPLAIKEKSLNPAMTWIQAMSIAAKKVGQVEEPAPQPPASATPPANTSGADRNIGEQTKADRVWNDDTYFKEIEDKLFG